jgi:inositol oxygenase
MASPDELAVYFHTAMVQNTPFVVDRCRRWNECLLTLPRNPKSITLTFSGPCMADDLDLACWLFNLRPLKVIRLPSGALLMSGEEACLVLYRDQLQDRGPYSLIINCNVTGRDPSKVHKVECRDNLSSIERFQKARQAQFNDIHRWLETGAGIDNLPTLEECLSVQNMLTIADEANICEVVPVGLLGRRVYDQETSPPACVELYHNQRKNQNYEMARDLARRYARGGHLRMTMWEALQCLRTLVDQSDPDLVGLGNDVHALQTAQLLEDDGRNEFWVVMGLIHDVGKIMYLFGNDEDGTSVESQWGVVGDTFVTGYPIPKHGVPFSEFNQLNEDHASGCKRWEKGCGLHNVVCSFGHDEYLYQALSRNRDKHCLPDECLTIIRFHSLYPWHTYGAYQELEDGADRTIKPYVRLFQAYDLHSKSDDVSNLSWNDPKWRQLVERVFGTEKWDW